MLLNLCFKFKSARITLRVTQIRVVFLRTTPFVNFTVLSMKFSFKKLFVVFFSKPMGIFIRLSCHILRAEVTTKKTQMPSKIKLLAGTKVYYCFNSKGDNFKVNQL